MKDFRNIVRILVITFVIASSFVCCKSKIAEADKLDLSKAPTQRVQDVFAFQTSNGEVEMRIEADVMEHYTTDDLDYDYFPEGLAVYGYTEEGLLESVILADEALHSIPKLKGGEVVENWKAYGNVVLHNVLKQSTMETDTIYWDQEKKEVYTDCYVKLYTPDGMMQGTGMRSDDHLRDAILHNSFNNYAIINRDTTVVSIDSVNFIGPFPKK